MLVLLITLIMFISGGSLIATGLKSEERIFSFLGSIIIIVSIGITFHYFNSEINKQIEHAKDCIENGYPVYLNGQEIDASHIILSDYEIRITEDCIILREK